MSDINVRIGGDNSDYLRVLNQSEVSSAEFNKRVAAQTAAVVGAESRLAEIRGRNDTLRAAGFNQDIFLQREILALKAEIATMEAGSLAQTEKKIILEGKVLQLEQIIASQKVENATATRAQSAGLEEATTKAVTLKDALKSMGVTIKGAGIGAAFALLISGAKEAIANATALRDKLRETGQPIDSATRSMAAFGDGLKGIKQFGIDAVGFLIGGFTQLGDVIGSAINRVRGISEAEENQIAAIADETERVLARIAVAKKKFEEENTPEKRAAREKQALADQEQAWKDYLAEVGRLQKAAADKQAAEGDRAMEIADAYWNSQKKAIEDNRELLILQAKSVTGLTVEEAKRLKILELQAKQLLINAEIDELLLRKKVQGLNPAEQQRLNSLIKQNGIIESQIANVGKVKDAVAEITPVIESNIEAWRKFQQAITSTGRGDGELSDRELQRKISNIQQDLFQRQLNSQGGGFDFFLEPQKNNLRQTRAELDLRNRVRSQAGAFGEDRAFAMNPGLTEQRFREILQGIDTSTTGKLATAIDKLNQRLDGPLLATLKPSPFGP